jgi:hypothetical protein
MKQEPQESQVVVSDYMLQVTPGTEEEIAEVERAQTVSMSDF